MLNGQVTRFVGNYYEKKGSQVTKYYYAGAQRIAVRRGGTLSYLLGDHLGSTSVVAAPNGGLRTRTLYKPWGEVRYQSGTLPTEYTFTGQYSHVDDFGLMYYVARWYDPALGRFVQADTVVPGAGSPSAWDRYAYTQNNPLRYTDPSGHCPWCLVGALVGAAIGYGTQVYNNYQNGYTSTDAWTENISAAPIVSGALLGAGAVILAPAAAAATSEALAGIAVTTGSTTLMEASIATGGTATTLATAVYGASTATTTSDITVGTNILDYPSGTGFSAAYDSSTGAMEFMPSINSPTPPDGWVQQFGGHQVVADSMVANGSNPGDLYGFAVKSDLPDTLSIVSWNSGRINLLQHGDRTVPLEMQSEIINMLQSGGWQVDVQ